jgi:tetratricopeptide (TPR) repeat protein
VVSILLHALAAVLVFLLCRRLFRGRVSESVAMLAGLLFALHPLATESINFLAVRGGLMAGVFSLLSIALFLRATQDEASIRPGAYVASLIAFALAWGSSPAVVGLPLLALAADRIANGGRTTLARFTAHLGYWALLLVLVTAHMAAFSTPPTVLEPTGLSFTTRLAALTRQYVWIAAPQYLSAFHPLPEEGVQTQALVAGACAVLFIAAGLWLLWKRSVAGFALLWFAIMQLGWALMARPEHGISEYQAYLPLVGAALLLPWAFTLVPSLGKLRTIAGVAAAILLVAAGVGTFSRNQVWQSDEDLWTDAAAKYPDAAEPHLRLGRALTDDAIAATKEAALLAQQKDDARATQRQADAEEQFRAADEELKKALLASPGNVDALFTQGEGLEYTGHPNEAADAYRKVLETAPGHFEALWRLARLTQSGAQPGDTATLSQAVAMYRRADEAERLPADVLPAYARALVTLGAAEESRSVLQRAVALSSGEARQKAEAALNGLAKTLQNIGTLSQQAMTAVQQAPNSPEALRLRGQLLSVQGHDLQASYALDAAVRRNPQDSTAWLLLGLARARMDSAATFVREWPTAPPSPVPNTTPWRTLADSTAASGDWKSAIVYLQAAQASGELGNTALPIAAADIAVQERQPRQAEAFLQQAAEAAPTDPVPWLRLTDLAIEQGELARARAFYVKARERNAAPEELAKREAKLGNVPQAGAPAILR